MATRIIEFTKFSGDEGAKQMADLNVRSCDSVIYCKTQAEANCYRAIIEYFQGNRRGVDHFCGVIAICVDPASTMIEGMHLLRQSIPYNIKQSYPFQLQANKIGKERQEKFLESCGLTTEKELKAVWTKCANRLRFPVEATYDEKEKYTEMLKTAYSIISDAENNKKKAYLDELKQVEEAIVNWFTMKFGKNFQSSSPYPWKKTNKYVYSVDGYRSFTFVVDIDYSQSRGIQNFCIIYLGLNNEFTFSWNQDKNIDAVIKRIEMMWTQFSTIMEAISKSYKATTMNITV